MALKKLNFLVFFPENLVFAFWRQTDRDRQTNRWTVPLHEAALAVASGGLITLQTARVLWTNDIDNCVLRHDRFCAASLAT